LEAGSMNLIGRRGRYASFDGDSLENRRIDISYPMSDVEGIKVEWKEG
jgi:hypothetical protein